MNFIKKIKREVKGEIDTRKEQVKKTTKRQVPVKTLVHSCIVVASVTAAAVLLYDQKKILDIKKEFALAFNDTTLDAVTALQAAYNQGIEMGRGQV